MDRLERDFARVLGMTPKPEPVRYESPDLGNPDQHFDQPQPFEFELSPADRHAATMAKIQLEANRRKANKLAEDADIARLGVVWTDDEVTP